MKIIQWLAYFFTTGGNIFLLQGNPELVAYSYAMFLVGNFLWIHIAIKTKLNALVALNITFIIMGMIGLYNWI